MSFLTEMQKYLYETEHPYKNGWDIIEVLDADEDVKQYRNNDAEYDEEYYELPVELFTKITGIEKVDIQDVSDSLEDYEGNIRLYGDMVSVTGGA